MFQERTVQRTERITIACLGQFLDVGNMFSVESSGKTL
jgi:hypothetical protein